VVGHEPDLSRLAEHILGARKPFVVLKKGGACLLDLDGAGEARLQWLAAPRMLREIGD
jgi:phosphohistidine phosphatase SixA